MPLRAQPFGRAFIDEFTSVAGAVEPFLLLQLGLMWLLGPWLRRQPYTTGIAAIFGGNAG